MHAANFTATPSKVSTWNDGRLNDNHNTILDNITILLLVGLLYICCVDNLAVAANAHVLVNNAFSHLRVGPCTDMHPTDAALNPISA